jgi:hypothetical protein
VVVSKKEGPQLRIRRVRLVEAHDPGYLDFMADQRLRNQHLGPRQEASAMQRLSTVLEEAGRAWLGERLTLTPRRVLGYEVQQGSYSYRTAYRELDAVEGSEERPAVIFEMKVSSNPRVIRQACAQLQASLDVASRTWPRLRGCVLYINMGGDPAQEGGFGNGETALIADVAERLTQGDAERRMPCLVLLAQELWELARRQDVPPEDSLWVAAQREANENRSRRRERDQLLSAGVPPSEWPQELRQRQDRPKGEAVLAVGDPSGESALALALRRALGADGGGTGRAGKG